MFIFNSQKNIFSFCLILFLALLIFTLSISFLKIIKAAEVEEPIMGPIERELCKRIPLEETLKKYEQFQAEFIKTLMEQKKEVETIFSAGLNLVDRVILHNSRFCQPKTDCEEIDCSISTTICATRSVRADHCIKWEWIEREDGNGDWVCVGGWEGIKTNLITTEYTNVKLKVVRQYDDEGNIIDIRQSWVGSGERLRCRNIAKDHEGEPIYVTQRAIPFVFVHKSRIRNDTQDITVCRQICLQECGERIKKQDITNNLWIKIKDATLKNLVTIKNSPQDICKNIEHQTLQEDCERFRKRETTRLQRRLDSGFNDPHRGVRVGYFCTEHTIESCSGDPFIPGRTIEETEIKEISGIEMIETQGSKIETAGKKNREVLIENILFKRALAELMGRFDNIRQSFRIWYEGRVGLLLDCFKAKERDFVDICKYNLDYYICK